MTDPLTRSLASDFAERDDLSRRLAEVDRRINRNRLAWATQHRSAVPRIEHLRRAVGAVA